MSRLGALAEHALVFETLGVKDPRLQKIAKAGSTSKGKKNISRNFHSMLKRSDKLLPVKICFVKLRVLLHRPRVREAKIDYPYIRLQDWGEYLLRYCSKSLLGGFDLCTQEQHYTEMLTRFWDRYRSMDPGHPLYSTDLDSYSHVIPFCVHGDEGRGKARTAVLITSYQPVIGLRGEVWTNMKGYLGRFR